MFFRIVTTSCIVLALTGCSDPDAPATPSPHIDTAANTGAEPAHAATARFESDAVDLSVTYASDLQASTHFNGNQQAGDAWAAMSAPDSSGRQIFMLTLPDSNDVTTAQMRIGANSDAHAVANCGAPPDAPRVEDTGTTTVNGTMFRTFHAADAGMNHYHKVRGYRVTQDGQCIAIDLLVTGTNPDVYDPPRQPPFTTDAAFAKLRSALDGVHLGP